VLKEPQTFADYKPNGHLWITLAKGNYYPDYLEKAKVLYQPVLETFKELMLASESSERLFIQIADVKAQVMRVQLCRVFRKYVSPETPVEMLKKKLSASDIIARFGQGFRPIQEVQQAFLSRPLPDEALSAILWEYKDRGQSGYSLTERFFTLFRNQLPNLPISGPERAGKDILLGTVFSDYPNPKRPVDFVIHSGGASPALSDVLAVGLARYDSDRGGAQEDDRVGGYRDCADEVLNYAKAHGLRTKVIFLNDGPGLLLGSMWDDYGALETRWPSKIMVLTLRMVPERLTHEWLLS